MTLPAARQEAILRALGGIPDSQEQLAAVIGWKSKLETLHDADRTDANLVRGCMSRVWLVTRIEEGRCRFRVDAASVMVHALVGMMCGIYEGATPEEVIAEEPVIFEELGILRNLSPTRQSGLAAVRRALLEFAERAR